MTRRTHVSPGEDQKIEREEADLEDLDTFKVSEYRQLAARANFMTLARADTQCAVEEICRDWVGTFVAVHELSRCSSTRSEVEYSTGTLIQIGLDVEERLGPRAEGS